MIQLLTGFRVWAVSCACGRRECRIGDSILTVRDDLETEGWRVLPGEKRAEAICPDCCGGWRT